MNVSRSHEHLLDLFFRSAHALSLDNTAIQAALQALPSMEADPIQQHVAAAYHVSQDESIGLRLAANTEMVASSSLVYLMLSSPTLAVALESLSHYADIVVQRKARIRTSWFDGRFHLEYCDVAASPHFVDYTGALIVRLCRLVVWHNIAPVETHLVRQEPIRGDYRRIFGDNVHFKSRHNVLIWSREQLQLPSRHANAAIHTLHEEAVLREYQALAASAAVREVRRRVVAYVGTPAATLQATAKYLGVTPRTLQRYLRAHGMDFYTLTEAARKARALELVHNSQIDVDTIPHTLGYASQTAFLRAFRRWTGTTPLRMRKRFSSAQA